MRIHSPCGITETFTFSYSLGPSGHLPWLELSHFRVGTDVSALHFCSTQRNAAMDLSPSMRFNALPTGTLCLWADFKNDSQRHRATKPHTQI